MKYVQIIDSKVHGKWEADALPEVASNITLVVIDGVSPEPDTQWTYTDGKFSPPEVTQESLDAALVSLKSRALLALQKTDVVYKRMYEDSISGKTLDKTSVQEWSAYCTTLRSILTLTTWTDTVALPTKPDYPKVI